MHPSRWLTVTLLILSCALTLRADSLTLRPPRFLVLTSSGQHYPKLAEALSMVGYQIHEVDYYGYLAARHDGEAILIIPESDAAVLTDEQQADLLADIRRGRSVILEGPSALAKDLGIGFTPLTVQVTKYRWRASRQQVSLPTPLFVPHLIPPAGSRVLAQAPPNASPLLLAGTAGRGRFLYSALPLEPAWGGLAASQPLLLQAIVAALAITPQTVGDGLCVYLDWAYHARESPAALVDRLRRWHIRRVSFSAWYDGPAYRAYLRRFIREAHRVGMQVDMWLELPMVSEAFWRQHPEWREVTAGGQHARLDWRYLMALEDPDCFRAVSALLTEKLRAFDWDGVNIAELYFETPGLGIAHPPTFTPMHPVFRASFLQRFGIDPRALFDEHSISHWGKNPRLHEAMIRERVDLVTRLNEQVIQLCLAAGKPGLQVMVTMVDALLDPRMREWIGADPEQLLALPARFPIALQVEDPFTLWSLGADRYRVLGTHYRQRLPAGVPLALDINVVDRKGSEQFLATPKQRGLELYALIAAAGSSADQVYLYGTGTLVPEDMALAAGALNPPHVETLADGRVRYTAARQCHWQVDTRGIEVVLDGHPWPCLSATDILLPAGTHTLSVRPRSETEPLFIEDLTGALLSATRRDRGIALTYRSFGRGYLTLSRPATLLCDGAPLTAPPARNGETAVYVIPAGEHRLLVE